MCHSVFFFSSRRRHTRLQGDWSSDVCSSDLSASRSSSLPDVPTMEEAGMPGFRTSTWYGLWAPKNTPQDVVQKLDRKSTRLNSSHLVISYAVFCLKKKKKQIGDTMLRMRGRTS